MKSLIMTVLVFAFFLGCIWLGAVGFPRFCDWTIVAGYSDEIEQACPYVMAGGAALLCTSVAMLLKGSL